MLILIAMIAFAAGTVRSFNATSSWVLHTQDVRLQLGETLSQLKDALQDTRVHPIPGAEERLASQPQKRAEIAGLLADLREKTKDNAKQQEALRQLEGHVARAYHEIDAFTELRRAGNLVAVSERALAGGSTRLGDDIGATIHRMEAEEARLLEIRLAEARRDASLTITVLVCGFGFDALLIAGLVYVARRDLGAREETARALRDQAKEVEDLYNLAPCGYHSLDAGGRFIAVNQTQSEWLGFSREEMIGKMFLTDVMTPASVPAFNEGFRQLKEQGEMKNLEVTLCRRDGRCFPAFVSATSVLNAAGKFVASRSTIIDITERKHLDLLTSQARAYAESIVDTVREPLIILTPDLTVNSANRAFYTTFQTTPDLTVGQAFATLAGGHWNKPALLASLRTVIPEHRTVEDFEVTADFPRLGRKVMLLNARKLYRPGNNTTLTLVAIEDITLRKQALDELEAFSYSVSHDLRAPLRHIDGFTSMLREQLRPEQLDQKCQRYLNSITNAARGMGQLIDDLLAFAQIGRSELRRTRVQLEELVALTRRDLQSEIDGRNIGWHVGPLPQVEGDAALLRQVFDNLLRNAVKYTRGRAEAHIEIGAQDAIAGEVVIYVRDNGAGFDMKYTDKLFGVFQRLHSSAEFEGTGVGLANVRRIIQRHQGRTWAEGTVGAGATFYFSLPLAPMLQPTDSVLS